ncbi:caspase-8-like [Gastrophryne carolinensis]
MCDINFKFHEIISQLDSEETQNVIFLCKDLVPQEAPELSDLIIELKQRRYIDNGKTDLIAELLHYVKRYDLLRDYLNITKKEIKERMRIPGTANISAFRLLLYELSELVTDSQYQEMKNVFSDELPKAKLEKATNLLHIFIELEKKCVLENDLSYLKEKSSAFGDDFLKKIEEYEKMSTQDNCVSQDTQAISADSLPQSPEGFYKIKCKDRGTCLIINNFNFEKARQNYPKCAKNWQDRVGTNIDEVSINEPLFEFPIQTNFIHRFFADSLSEVFRILNFQVQVKKDLDGHSITKTVQSYSKLNYEDRDCFVCCLLSHGNKGVIFGTNGQSVPIKDLTCYFRSSLCPSLKGKPKLFFIQACQGVEPQKCVPAESDACHASGDSKVAQCDLIPNEPDFLLGMATTLDSLAFRDPSKGSWYIQSLCKELTTNRGTDLISILTKVNYQVSQNQTQNNETQIPQPWTTLTRNLILT